MKGKEQAATMAKIRQQSFRWRALQTVTSGSEAPYPCNQACLHHNDSSEYQGLATNCKRLQVPKTAVCNAQLVLHGVDQKQMCQVSRGFIIITLSICQLPTQQHPPLTNSLQLKLASKAVSGTICRRHSNRAPKQHCHSLQSWIFLQHFIMRPLLAGSLPLY